MSKSFVCKGCGGNFNKDMESDSVGYCYYCSEFYMKIKVFDLESKLSKVKNCCDYYMNRANDLLLKEQDKISFVVDKLVNIQKYISDNAVYVEEENFGREINQYIDYQIKQLRGV